jgi:hypothetical protein
MKLSPHSRPVKDSRIQPDRSVFSEDLNKYMSDAMLAEYRSSLGSLGPVQSFTESSRRKTDLVVLRFLLEVGLRFMIGGLHAIDQ